VLRDLLIGALNSTSTANPQAIRDHSAVADTLMTLLSAD